jgi:hypothetical protein
MGLVFLTEGWVKMLLEMMSLVVALNLVYVVIYLLIGRFLVGETAVKRHMTT